MTEPHSYPFEETAPLPAVYGAPPSEGEIRAHMEAQTRSILVSRGTATLWFILAGIALFSAAKTWFEPATDLLWYGPAFGLALLQVVLLLMRRDKMTGAQLERLILIDAAATCAVIAWLGIESGRTTGSDFFLMGVAINMAAILPWGQRSQARLAVIAAVAILANGVGVHGALIGSVDFRTFVPAVVLIGGSVYTSRILEGSRMRSARADLLRKRAELETHELNVALERRVIERTAELQAANAELEAFAYSVSHDLRAPLRAMDGLSEVLLEDYSASLDAQGKDLLERIRGEAGRLGILVDDLLRLSRVTRTSVQRADVDLSALAATVAATLQKSEPERHVQFAIAEGLHDRCDGDLVRILFENLLGNAFKFSRKNPRATIELGCEQNGGMPVYFVRDNGVGFDMAHVGKIFGAFEQLHSGNEFEGTGIGLATVERIVRRHGGTIRAEAEPGRGATFRFTLAPAEEETA